MPDIKKIKLGDTMYNICDANAVHIVNLLAEPITIETVVDEEIHEIQTLGLIAGKSYKMSGTYGPSNAVFEFTDKANSEEEVVLFANNGDPINGILIVGIMESTEGSFMMLGAQNPEDISSVGEFSPVVINSIIEVEPEYATKESVDNLEDEFKKKGIHYIPKSEFTTIVGSSDINQSTSHKLCLPNVDGVTTPFDGMTISFPMPLTDESSYAKIAISIDGGDTYYPAGTAKYGFRVNIQEDSITTLLFNANKEGEIFENGVSTQITGCWQITNYDSDQKVLQKAITNSSTDFPVLITPMTGWSTFTSNVAFSNNVTVSPYRGRVSAKEFKENGVSLADKYALKDAISSGITFIPKSAFTVADASYSDRSMKWTVNNIDGITKPFDGMVVALMIPKSPSTDESPKNIAMSIDGGTEYHPLIRNDRSPLKQKYFTEDDIILVAYNGSRQATVYLTAGKQTLITGCWQMINTNMDGVEKTNLINTGYYNTSTIDSIDEKGITYSNGFQFHYANNINVKTGEYKSTLPIVAGDGVEITYDVNSDGGEVAKINNTRGESTPLVEITYNDLKALRDSGQLIPGMFYHITDYVCTTAQENTTAVQGTDFDIIVQALSKNSLSETASACAPNGNPVLMSSVLTNKTIKSHVVPYYYEYVDYSDQAADGVDPNYRQGKDVFIAYDYLANNEGTTVPVIYKTDAAGLDPTKPDFNSEFDGPDYEDQFYYEGTADISGVTYDKWRLINEVNDEFTWDGTAKCYIYTNQIVNNGTIELDSFLYEEETDEYRLDSSAVALNYYELVDCNSGYDLMSDDGKKFAAYEYLPNDKGDVVPVLYDWTDEGVGYNESYYYDGQATIEGQVYDKWRKIELDTDDFGWDTPGKAYYYTNVIVEGGGSISSNINFPAWEIKYCLDNDKTRFAWADEENGKGVIYYMKDEWDNECHYDFKNIMFKRSTDWFTSHNDWCENILGYVPTEDKWFYTFTWVDENDAAQDLTLIGNSLLNDEGKINGVFGNKIGICSEYWIYLGENSVEALSYNVFVSSYYYEGGIFYGCHSNTLGSSCYANTFGNSCSSNTFGSNCQSNTFNSSCDHNTFGSQCGSNTFNSDCNYNTFGMGCRFNTFNSSCDHNTFGNQCDSNTFGVGCHFNTFGNKCYFNTIAEYARYNIFENNVKFVTLTTPTQGDVYNHLQKIKVCLGVSGSSTTNPLVITADRNLEYETKFVVSGSKEVLI